MEKTLGQDSGFNSLSIDVFHVEGDEVERIPWGKLSSEVRVQKLKEYFEKEFNNEHTQKTISKSTMDIIIDMASGGGFNHKKDVSYDEINQRIIKIFALYPEQFNKNISGLGNNYIYKPEKISMREKSKKSAKTKLFRKK